MNGWAIAIVVYIGLATVSFTPVAWALFRWIDLKPGGPSFADSRWFSEPAKVSLEQHFERLRGSLYFWKNQAERYRRFHYYSLIWVAASTVAIPVLSQAIGKDPYSKWLLTTISVHAGFLIVLSRSLKVEAHYQAFRNGESDFYDLYRRMLDRPMLFGSDETEQLERYFEQVELVRKFVRSAETDSFPSLSDISRDHQQIPNVKAIDGDR